MNQPLFNHLPQNLAKTRRPLEQLDTPPAVDTGVLSVDNGSTRWKLILILFRDPIGLTHPLTLTRVVLLDENYCKYRILTLRRTLDVVPRTWHVKTKHAHDCFPA